ncbi:hypothetical protein AMTRI_Chr02g218210 [Amborella trichopoda]|uniref:LysM domain-containing protein n=1 Tax=Amborella trichopoda TaxID=13333 RepID=W1P113_AMBTC|nr:hypothetical protein AMTR_s00003p00271140 [Amborella trichopoda]
MEKAVTNGAVLLHSIFILTLLLAVSMANARSFKGFEALATKTPDCFSVYGVIQGDTCFAVTQQFNITQPCFEGLNPNLNCSALFIGQWLCVAGSF